MIVKTNLVFVNKLDALEKISIIAKEEGLVTNSRLYLKGLLERENKFSTDIGNNISIPHCRCSSINKIFIIICTLKDKIKWNIQDNQDVDFIIAFGIPSSNLDNKYLEIISKLAKNLMKEEFVKELKSLDSEEEIINKVSSIIS